MLGTVPLFINHLTGLDPKLIIGGAIAPVGAVLYTAYALLLKRWGQRRAVGRR